MCSVKVRGQRSGVRGQGSFRNASGRVQMAAASDGTWFRRLCSDMSTRLNLEVTEKIRGFLKLEVCHVTGDRK